jgi:cell wall-associated NlpC family hydrolase
MPTSTHRLRHLALESALLASLGCMTVPALAAPDGAADPMMRLLAERGVLGARPSAGAMALSPSSTELVGGSAGAGAQAALSPVSPTPSPLSDVPALTRLGLGDDPAAPAGQKMLDRVRERAADMVLTALNFVGVRYQRGGNSEEAGFDCSGFTRLVFSNSIGLLLPRRADDQAYAPGLVDVRRQDLQPGDLVFFNTLKRTFSHVGIYIGGNRFVHAPRPGGEVRTEDMGFAYWQSRFTGARRAQMVALAPEPPIDSQPQPPTPR